jgi:hypothetical protein
MAGLRRLRVLLTALSLACSDDGTSATNGSNGPGTATPDGAVENCGSPRVDVGAECTQADVCGDGNRLPPMCDGCPAEWSEATCQAGRCVTHGQLDGSTFIEGAYAASTFMRSAESILVMVVAPLTTDGVPLDCQALRDRCSPVDPTVNVFTLVRDTYFGDDVGPIRLQSPPGDWILFLEARENADGSGAAVGTACVDGLQVPFGGLTEVEAFFEDR